MSKKNRQDNKRRETKLEPGLMIPVEYIRAVDGDTVEVEIRRTFHIRLRDINVAERDTNEGIEATEFVNTVMNFCDDILVFIPTNDPVKLMDITSFERIVGDIYLNGELLQDLLREKGYG
jgi:endonuclease YncB( thermonuclease family)